MPKNAGTRSRAGDLYVKFQVEMPDLDWVRRQQVPAGSSEVSMPLSTVARADETVWLQVINVALPGKKVDQAIPEDTITVVKLKECPAGKVRMTIGLFDTCRLT